MIQHTPLECCAARGGKMPDNAVCSHNPVTWHDQRKSIAGHHRADGPGGAWLAGKACQLRIRPGFANRNLSAMSSHGLLKRRPIALVELNIKKLVDCTVSKREEAGGELRIPITTVSAERTLLTARRQSSLEACPNVRRSSWRSAPIMAIHPRLVSNSQNSDVSDWPSMICGSNRKVNERPSCEQGGRDCALTLAQAILY